MMHELTFNELVVESRYLLKLQWLTIVFCLNILWLKAVNEITAKFIKVCNTEYLTTQIELVLPNANFQVLDRSQNYRTKDVVTRRVFESPKCDRPPSHNWWRGPTSNGKGRRGRMGEERGGEWKKRGKVRGLPPHYLTSVNGPVCVYFIQFC